MYLVFHVSSPFLERRREVHEGMKSSTQTYCNEVSVNSKQPKHVSAYNLEVRVLVWRVGRSGKHQCTVDSVHRKG